MSSPPRAQHVGYSLAFSTVCPFALPPRANLDKAPERRNAAKGLDFEGQPPATTMQVQVLELQFSYDLFFLEVVYSLGGRG